MIFPKEFVISEKKEKEEKKVYSFERETTKERKTQKKRMIMILIFPYMID